MLQSQIEEEIDVPKEMQTMLKLCLIIKCQWIQLKSAHLDNDVDGVRWWDIFGWRNLEILNMCFQTFLASWFVPPSKCFQTLLMFGFLINVQWIHEEINFPITYA